MVIKNPNKDYERYKARFVVQGHKDKEKEYLIQLSKTIRIRNIGLLITLTAIYHLKFGIKMWHKHIYNATIYNGTIT